MLISFDSGCKPYQGDERQGRVGLFQCECGCGQTFFAPVKTRHPRYVNKTHRARAYRARARARAMAYHAASEYHIFSAEGAVYRYLPEYQEGRNARVDGRRRGRNPYSLSAETRYAVAWWVGWDDEDEAILAKEEAER